MQSFTQSTQGIQDRSDTEIVAALRSQMPDLYFVNTPVTRMRRDLAWLERLPEAKVVLDFYRPPQSPLTELTICAYDNVGQGLLSRVSGTLLSLDINIHTALIYTLPQRKGNHIGRRIAFDTLFISESYRRRTRPLSEATERQLAKQLSRVLAGEADVESLLNRVRRRIEPPIQICEFATRNEGQYTILTLAAQDNRGVLYRVTTALAALNLNIELGQVNTFESAVDDILYVTDAHGQPLTDEQLQDLEARLRNQLQR